MVHAKNNSISFVAHAFIAFRLKLISFPYYLLISRISPTPSFDLFKHQDTCAFFSKNRTAYHQEQLFLQRNDVKH
jgi:hypothetical protein